MTSRIDMKGMPGFRFLPTNEELIGHFLKLKLLGYDDQVSAAIAEIDINKYEPWQLPQFAATESDNDTWYFFTRPDYIFANSRRANRKTIGGYWKVTGKERKILGKDKNEIATKKSLVYYEGRAPKGVKTNWVIHEYHSSITYSLERDFVLCRLKKNPDEEDNVNLEEGQSQSQPSQKENPKESNFLHGDFESQCGFNAEQDLECPSAQELEKYMWKEWKEGLSPSSSSGKLHTDICSNNDCIYRLETMSDEQLDCGGAEYEGKLTEFANSLFV
ncbi:NAC domain-containing protein 69-like [Tripterygium wilfordii]|uniref:NAC domain-containing protein 69-like n=1 Tax=Tripterygium wilfordii TaxID=458696 RepID=UPI0018F8226F|nr:NAC domain-containing protein 69-like [Tripterygium wilfordii]